MIGRFLRSANGSVTVELALIVPIFVLIMWFGAEASYHYRLQNRLHRATATLADILANRELEEGETLPGLIPGEMPSALVMLQTMLDAGQEGSPGLSVTYYATPVPGTADDNEPLTWSTGRACGESGLASLEDLAVAGELITAENTAKAELVRVEACYSLEARWNVSDFVFPTFYSSHFVTLRKEW